MKHLKLFFALFAMLALGVGNAWAETATLTFSAKCGGKGTDTQGYNWTITSDGTESTFDKTKGIHYGTSSAKVKYIRLSTSDIPGTITEVKVNASTASGVTANLTVKVGSSDFTTGNSVTSQQLSTSATEYTFSGSASGEIIVEISKSSSATKAIYCKSVVVTYETSGSTETVVSLLPKNTIFEVLSSAYLRGIFGVSSAYLLRIFCCENCPAKPSLTTRLPLATSSHSPNTYPIPHKYRHLRGGIVVVTMDPRHLLFCVNEPKKLILTSSPNSLIVLFHHIIISKITATIVAYVYSLMAGLFLCRTEPTVFTPP